MPEKMIRFACPSCRKTIQAKPKFAGRKIACPGCQHPLRVPGVDAATQQTTTDRRASDSTVILRNSPPPTESEKREARKLGLAIPEKITQRELVERIEWHKKNRLDRIKVATNKLEAMLAEVTPEEFLDEMLVRHLTGVLILFDADEYMAERTGLGEATPKILSTVDLSPDDLRGFLEQCLAKLSEKRVRQP